MDITEKKIKLGIVDDDRLLVQLLIPIVEETNKIEVGLTAYSGNEFISKIQKEHDLVEVILLDLRMNDGNGLEVLDYLRAKDIPIKVVVLSSYYQESFIGQMMKKGAQAFLPKIIDKKLLVDTIIEVSVKGHSFSKEQMKTITKQLSSKLPQLHLDSKSGLTEREVQVLQLLCQQFNTGEIAKQLFISPKTVETHKSNLISKTGVKNTAGLVIYAVQNQIINLDEVILLTY